jgi:putative endonuclease
MDSISDSDSEDAGSIPAGATVFVYVLANLVNAELYVGISNDLNRRLKEHNAGKNRYTKAYAPWRIVYSEELGDYTSARVREKYLKSHAGKKSLRKKLIEAGSLPA